MRAGALSCLLWLMVFIACPAQEISAQTPNYFPHAVGDTWEYEWHDLEIPPQPSSIWRKKITSNTVRADGMYELCFGNAVKPYYLYDSTGYLYSSDDTLLMNFRALPGEFCGRGGWGWYYTYVLDSVYYGEVFGQIRRIWVSTGWVGSTPEDVHYYAEGIGEFYSRAVFLSPENHGETNLRGAIIDGVQYGATLSLEDRSSVASRHNILGQNYPNPFSSSTRIPLHFDTGEAAFMLEVYDGLGRCVRTYSVLHDGTDNRVVLWDGRDAVGRPLPDGIYHARVFGNGKAEGRMLVKSGR